MEETSAKVKDNETTIMNYMRDQNKNEETISKLEEDVKSMEETI